MNQALVELKDAIINGDHNKVDSILVELDSRIAFDEIFTGCVNPALDYLCSSISHKTGAVPELLMGLRQVQRIAASRKGNSPQKPEKFLMGVIEGDIHDMGKNVIRDVFKGYGYEVLDLGKNIPPAAFADAALTQQTDIACLSTMMSTTIEAMKDTITLLKTARPGIRVLVGGAFINREIAESLNADGYAEDASSVMAELSKLLQ